MSIARNSLLAARCSSSRHTREVCVSRVSRLSSTFLLSLLIIGEYFLVNRAPLTGHDSLKLMNRGLTDTIYLFAPPNSLDPTPAPPRSGVRHKPFECLCRPCYSDRPPKPGQVAQGLSASRIHSAICRLRSNSLR